jgi:hypothetical protein
MTLELESMTLGIDLLGLDQLIRVDKLPKPPMLLAQRMIILKRRTTVRNEEIYPHLFNNGLAPEDRSPY